MLVRALLVASLLLAGALALYLPSAYPPERFVQQVRTEHALTGAFWGEAQSLRILARMLDFYEGVQSAQPFGQGVPHTPPPSAVDAAVAAQLAQVTQAFAHNAYFRSIDALFLLLVYRLAALVEWLAPLGVFVLAALLDGLLRRVIKSKSFEQHNAEAVGVHAIALVVVACAAMVTFVLPLTVHPAWLAAVPIVISICASIAIANYHRRA